MGSDPDFYKPPLDGSNALGGYKGNQGPRGLFYEIHHGNAPTKADNGRPD
ncbi:hypothetical protein GCM10007071_24590 [Marinobacter zhanjiangensis]|uniref:Uncharacterized protein n=1 Tax=Marinobacter zhanjiangensis TaxID=578215 RepID=A0ABQ3B4A0_9GAMM|nr:hypothetical protein GCM10007071_24590 [Marinobacter zhanjiangensis]